MFLLNNDKTEKNNIFGIFLFEEKNEANHWRTCFFIFLRSSYFEEKNEFYHWRCSYVDYIKFFGF